MYKSIIFVVALAFVSGVCGARDDSNKYGEACAILGLADNFTADDLKQARKELLLKYHLDKNMDKTKEEQDKYKVKTVQVCEAYNYLKTNPTPPAQTPAASSTAQTPSARRTTPKPPEEGFTYVPSTSYKYKPNAYYPAPNGGTEAPWREPSSSPTTPPAFPTAGAPTHSTTYTAPKSYSPGSTYTPEEKTEPTFEQTFWQSWEDMSEWIFKDIKVTVVTGEEQDGRAKDKDEATKTEENQEGTTTERREYIYVGDNEGNHDGEIQGENKGKQDEGSKNDQIQSTDELNAIKTDTTKDTRDQSGAISNMMESTPRPVSDEIGAGGDTTTQDQILSQPKPVSPEAPETKKPTEISQKVKNIFTRSMNIISSIVSTMLNPFINLFKRWFS